MEYLLVIAFLIIFFTFYYFLLHPHVSNDRHQRDIFRDAVVPADTFITLS